MLVETSKDGKIYCKTQDKSKVRTLLSNRFKPSKVKGEHWYEAERTKGTTRLVQALSK